MRLPLRRLLPNRPHLQSRLPPRPVVDSPNCCARWRWRCPHRLLRQPRLRLQETRGSRVSCRRWVRRLLLSPRHRGFRLPHRPSRQPRRDRAASRSCCKPCQVKAAGRPRYLELVRLRRPIGRPDPLRPPSAASREPLHNYSARWKALERRPNRLGSKPRLPPAAIQTPSRGCSRWSRHRLPPRLPTTKSASREASIMNCLRSRRVQCRIAIHSLRLRSRSRALRLLAGLALRG